MLSQSPPATDGSCSSNVAGTYRSRHCEDRKLLVPCSASLALPSVRVPNICAAHSQSKEKSCELMLDRDDCWNSSQPMLKVVTRPTGRGGTPGATDLIYPDLPDFIPDLSLTGPRLIVIQDDLEPCVLEQQHTISNHVKQSESRRGQRFRRELIPQGGRGGSSRGRGGGAGGNSNAGPERKKRESILNLQQYVDTSIRIKFMGGREGQLAVLPGS